MAKKQKKLSKLKEELWKVFSLYVKLKSSSDGENCRCFTCGKAMKIGTSQCQAGHYYSRSGFPGLYFNLINVHPQCFHCNINLSGNTQIYRERLISVYGEDAVLHLDSIRHGQLGYSRADYEYWIEHYTNQVIKLRNG
jgi:hypothetical protein